MRASGCGEHEPQEREFIVISGEILSLNENFIDDLCALW